MGMFRNLPSLAKPNIRYRLYESYIDVPCDYRKPHQHISDYVTAYDTYGDNDTQHTHEWHPNGPEDLRDFLRSLALRIPDEGHVREDWTLLPVLLKLWPHESSLPDRKTLLFLQDLKHDEKKAAWFNQRERKRSTSDSKRHDKRWEKVESNDNGSFGNVMYRTSANRVDGMLPLLHHMFWVEEVLECGCYDVYKHYEWTHQYFYSVRDPFRVIDEFVKGHRSINWAISAVESLKHNLDLEVARAEKSAATA